MVAERGFAPRDRTLISKMKRATFNRANSRIVSPEARHFMPTFCQALSLMANSKLNAHLNHVLLISFLYFFAPHFSPLVPFTHRTPGRRTKICSPFTAGHRLVSARFSPSFEIAARWFDANQQHRKVIYWSALANFLTREGPSPTIRWKLQFHAAMGFECVPVKRSN